MLMSNFAPRSATPQTENSEPYAMCNKHNRATKKKTRQCAHTGQQDINESTGGDKGNLMV